MEEWGGGALEEGFLALYAHGSGLHYQNSEKRRVA